MKEEYYDVDTERNVLKALFQNVDFLKSAYTYNLLNSKHFVDYFHKDAFNAIINYFKTYGLQPTYDRFIKFFLNYITYIPQYKSKEKQTQIWIKSLKRLFSEITEEEKRQLEADFDILENNRKARLIQDTIIKSTELFEENKFNNILEEFGRVQLEARNVHETITGGDIVTDSSQHENLMRLQREGLMKPLKTGITGVLEDDDGDFKYISLDDYLDGGLYNGDVTLLIGGNNVGKSMSLMDVSYNIARVEKQDVVLFTIEMSKIKTERRIYTRLTGIPYSKFRTGELSKKEMDLWHERLDEWKNKCGVFNVVAFDTGASVEDIQNKMKDIENTSGRKIGFIAIDYLNDMRPTGKFDNQKSWDAMGSISWSMAQLAKSWDNHNGIPIMTANQKKTEKENTTWEDAAYGKIVTQHASVGLGMSQMPDDAYLGRVKWDLFKNRDGKRFLSFYTYPKMEIGKINSMKRCRKHYEGEE